ncbi:GerAB/ArcD/ProY family transporter [Mycoplasmatota bacterium WC44]
MSGNKGKISVRQLMIIIIIDVYTPTARFLPAYVVDEAKQAAWLSPVITFIIFLTIIYASGKLFNKYEVKSYTEILNIITSKFIGKMIIVLYILWITYLLVWNVRVLWRDISYLGISKCKYKYFSYYYTIFGWNDY